jgi:hypothetical protein
VGLQVGRLLEALKKGFKMASPWPQWAKSNLKGALGTKGQQNGPFYGHAGKGAAGAPAGKGVALSRDFLTQN